MVQGAPLTILFWVYRQYWWNNLLTYPKKYKKVEYKHVYGCGAVWGWIALQNLNKQKFETKLKENNFAELTYQQWNSYSHHVITYFCFVYGEDPILNIVKLYEQR